MNRFNNDTVEENRFTAVANEFARTRDFGSDADDAGQDSLLSPVRDFVKDLYSALCLGRQHEVSNAYEVVWKDLSKKYFSESPWPEFEEISHLVRDDQTFLTLYKLLYFRHLLMQIPTKERPARMSEFSDAWDAYREFFDLILTAAKTAQKEQPSANRRADDSMLQAHTLPLPPTWIYDLLDEFLYHFQCFHERRNEHANALANETEAEEGEEGESVDEDADAPKRSAAVGGRVEMDLDEEDLGEVWRTEEVLRYLYRIVAETGVREKLSTHQSKRAAATSRMANISQTAPEVPKSIFGKTSLYQGAYVPQSFTELAGYFSLIVLLRLHTKLGDYGSALECASYIDLTAESFFARVPKAHSTLCYYYGFSLLMAGRHADAAALFSRVLLFFERTSTLRSKDDKNDSRITKFTRRQMDKMYTLLSIPLALAGYSGTRGVDARSLSLLPGVEEVVARTVVDRHGEAMAKIANAASMPLPHSVIAKAARIFPEPDATEEEKQKVYHESLTDVSDEVRNTLAPALEVITDAFTNASPGYIVPVVSVGKPADIRALTRRQIAVLREETLSRAVALPHIRSYMRLYTSIDTAKLSTFLGLPQADIPQLLLGLKIKSWQRQGIAAVNEGENNNASQMSSHGSPTEVTKVQSFSGRSCFPFASSDLIHFFVSGDMVQVEESKKSGDAAQMFAHSVLEFASIKEKANEALEEEREKKLAKVQPSARISAVRVSSSRRPQGSYQQGSKFGSGRQGGGSYASRLR
eukprot:gb/GECG01002707.1/.p1 GENE.gb/GECG01002707.1/~~gb/GECG01002707.1/.p1  ORF type:complete len:754 (+),score=102.59 gb/GECG01002707.1/:1-2262(+)